MKLLEKYRSMTMFYKLQLKQLIVPAKLLMAIA